ncbi:PREDICTED: ribosomal RNA processing protein 1 homolog [Theobroma cacao]|uniref:Ribosomal RNA processing protein 1 homolog n=1 Tax=Theobroma cacao TaxID=3641 RepID=A0AB32WVT0_THECC|nr:PREDICTED: ribosomal RNA processing protein 1 homolog [Theobroma cacao]
MAGSGAGEGPTLIKQLAACDKSTRDRAVRSLLHTWLPSQAEVSDEEMKRLWKGLFYCVWHADKLPAQSDLVEKLSSVLPKLEPGLSLQYFSVFLLTMRREWTGIDKLRLDKFYLLIRRFLNCFFVMLKKWSWDLDFTRRSIRVLVDGTFLADDKFQGNGVNYHIASIFLEEIRPFLPVKKEVVEVLLEPFVGIMGKVGDKVLVGKIRSNVFDVFVKMGRRFLELKRSGDEVDEGEDLVVLGTISLLMGFSAKFYELGSSADCCQGNRKVVLGLHEEFLKLEKDLTLWGIDVSIPEPNEGGEEDEVPELIPIASEMEVDDSDGVSEPAEVNANGSAKKALKKSKKAKKATRGSGKKTKKCKNAECSPADQENDVMVPAESANSSIEQNGDGHSITFTESVISNLQLQFEKVAAEVGLDGDVASACDLPKVNGAVSKKRKRVKSVDGQKSQNGELTNQGDGEGGGTAKTGEKSTKRVRFSMKNNLVWKPHSPLPPQSLRLPPSVTPRGSALKKGIPPGPITEVPPLTKKVKKAKSVKKARKVIKSMYPLVKRTKKLKSVSS